MKFNCQNEGKSRNNYRAWEGLEDTVWLGLHSPVDARGAQYSR
ncbi:hypothetical protein LEMLEM_LOCUS20718, partial [Lemmus lemmus]